MGNSSGSISQRLISGSVLVMIGKVLAAASALVLNILLTRLLAPGDVGVYYLLVSVVTMCGLAAQLGVHQAIVRALAGGLGAKHEDMSRASISAAFIIVTFGVLMIGLPYALGIGQWLGKSVFDSPLASDMAIITALWIAGFALQMLLSQIFRGFHRIGFATLFEGTSTGVFIIIGLTYVWLTQDQLKLQDVLIITLGALLLSILLALILLRRFYEQTMPTTGVDIRGMLRISLPLFVSSTVVLGITELHILILGSVNNEDTVAIYGAAYRLAKFIVVPLLIINSVIPPMVAQFVAQGKMNEVERVLRVTAAVAGVPVIALLVIIVLGASPILDFFYGEFYAQGASVLIILVAAQTVNALTGSPGVLLMMSNHQTIVMKLALVSGVLGIVTSSVLVGFLGATGVALGVAVGLSAHNLGMWAYCKFKLGVNTHMSMHALKDAISEIRQKVAAKF